MSRFIDAIREHMTGRRTAILEPMSVGYVRLKDGQDISNTFQTADEFEFAVTWKVRASCQKQDLPRLRDNVIRELQEAVYGDLRDRVLRLERAIYEQDREKVLMATRDLLREVMG